MQPIEFRRTRRSRSGPDPSTEKQASWSRPFAAVRPWHVGTAAAVLAVALVIGVGWVGYRARQVADHLGIAARLFEQLQRQIETADLGPARTTLAALQLEVKDARAETSGPAWGVASAAPKIGDDLAAVRTVSAALDDLASRGLPPLIDVAAGLEAALLAPRDGRFDLTTVQATTSQLASAETVIRRARERVASIRTQGLAPRIKSKIPELLRGLRRVEQLIGPAGRVANLLPAMLGASGPRSYLVLFQNLAEARATGGELGAFIVLQADKGAVTIVDHGTPGSLGIFDAPVLPLDPDMASLHTDRLGTYPADVNFTPDFPTTAALAREMYRRHSGRTVDGVIATDPVALAYLLKATGPIPVAVGAPLTPETAVRTLLSTVYSLIPEPGKQDAFFASAATDIFDVLVGRRADPRAALAALIKASSERRLLIWSAHVEEQHEVDGTMLAGQLPSDDGSTPTVGVFLNDGSGAKLSYYLTHAASLTVGDCMEDGTVELKLSVTIGSTAPRSGLSPYVLGMGLSGDPYTVRTNVLVYSPTGGGVVEASVNGTPASLGSGVERNRFVGVLTVDLPPGVTKKLDFTVLTGVLPTVAGRQTTPHLWTTPGVNPWPTTIISGRGCRK